MQLVKAGQISNCCHPNALMTLKEYLVDYAGEATRRKGEALIQRELLNIGSDKVRQIVAENLARIEQGARDFRF